MSQERIPTVTLRSESGSLAIVNESDEGEWLARGYVRASGEPSQPADLPPAVAVPPKRGPGRPRKVDVE